VSERRKSALSTRSSALTEGFNFDFLDVYFCLLSILIKISLWIFHQVSLSFGFQDALYFLIFNLFSSQAFFPFKITFTTGCTVQKNTSLLNKQRSQGTKETLQLLAIIFKVYITQSSALKMQCGVKLITII